MNSPYDPPFARRVRSHSYSRSALAPLATALVLLTTAASGDPSRRATPNTPRPEAIGPGTLDAMREAKHRTPPQAAVPIDHERAAALFGEARELERSNPWSGELFGPILFVERGARYVVASEADAEGMLREVDGVFVGTLPESEGIANTAMSWAGRRWTMVMWPLPDGYFERRRLVGHELFHRLGPELGVPMESPLNEHLDTAEGRVWLRLELRALARALASSAKERRRAVEDALAFRARRHEAFPGGAAEERALELNEGLAEYTGVRVSLPAGARAGWAVQRLESREVGAAGAGVTRNFAYASGPAYGLLLDDALPGWQADIEAYADLGALLGRAFGVSPGGALAAGADDRLARYDGPELVAFETEREAERARREAEFRERFVDSPVLTLPVDEQFGYTFDPNGVATLEGVGQVLASAKVRGGWGLLDVTGGVLLRWDAGLVTAVVVAAPEDRRTPARPGGDTPAGPLAGDGWTLTLAEGWMIAPGERDGDWVVRPRQPS